MTDIDEDKALAALKLGDVLLTNLVEENKRLKADRDELLEALQKALIAVECGDETGYVEGVGFIDIDAILIEAKAAIAKATGKPI